MKRKTDINILFCGINAVIWKKISILLLISVLSSEYALSGDTGVTPFNTVILSNETDGDFCKDFSVILDRLTLDWVYLKTPDIPDKIKDKNLIILGGPDAPCTGILSKGGKLNLELSQDWIRLYLLRGSCGNTVAHVLHHGVIFSQRSKEDLISQ